MSRTLGSKNKATIARRSNTTAAANNAAVPRLRTNKVAGEKHNVWGNISTVNGRHVRYGKSESGKYGFMVVDKDVEIMGYDTQEEAIKEASLWTKKVKYLTDEEAAKAQAA